jgi:hypothetical protein
MKNGVLKVKFATVVNLTTILAFGLAHSPVAEALRGIPNCVEQAGDVMGFFHRVATGFIELSERMDPTCSECNQP